ncbi:hypothetical protein AG4045_006258 [Apium graveolens]|uniref:Uncharacterized protein n=1 Tax=Apium graveolens TaxID=4045 RepID=A0A6L5BB94_APIGR|nr:hypothetical protein AG4045_006258 [Apium graveolens]
MDKMVNETSSEAAFTPTQSHETVHDQNQEADLNSPSSVSVIRKTSTPDRLKVPKPFKFPERYTSPTDLMVSPVSKELDGLANFGCARSYQILGQALTVM